MANETPFRGAVSVEKLERDAQRIKEYVRFAIILNGEHVKVIDNKNRRDKKLPYARIIAVLGEYQHKNVLVTESVLMEVGYCRSRPYKDLEEKVSGAENPRGRRWYLTSRRQARSLTKEEFSLVYPYIVKCMASIVLEQRADWKATSRGRWWVDGPGPIERGIHFTVAERDELMFRQMVREDIRYRKERYISGHAARVRRFVRTYGSSYYTTRQLKRFVNAQKIAELLSQKHYTPFYRSVLCRCFPTGSHEQLLLEAIAKAFRIDITLGEREEQLLDSIEVSGPPVLKELRCRYPERQPNGHVHRGHARDASVFEVLLEKGFKERAEIPF